MLFYFGFSVGFSIILFIYKKIESLIHGEHHYKLVLDDDLLPSQLDILDYDYSILKKDKKNKSVVSKDLILYKS